MPGGSLTSCSCGSEKLASAAGRALLELRLAAIVLLRPVVAEAADRVSQARAVARLPAAEADVVAEARAFLGGRDEAQPLARQPAVAGEPPLDHQAAAHLEQRAGAALGVQAQPVGGDMRLERGGGAATGAAAATAPARAAPGRDDGDGDLKSLASLVAAMVARCDRIG